MQSAATDSTISLPRCVSTSTLPLPQLLPPSPTNICSPLQRQRFGDPVRPYGTLYLTIPRFPRVWFHATTTTTTALRASHLLTTALVSVSLPGPLQRHTLPQAFPMVEGVIHYFYHHYHLLHHLRFANHGSYIGLVTLSLSMAPTNAHFTGAYGLISALLALLPPLFPPHVCPSRFW